MATSNATITKTWVKLAETADDPVLVTTRGAATIEFATTAADSAPTVARGHLLESDDAITRLAVGGGYLWARVEPDSAYATAKVEVSK